MSWAEVWQAAHELDKLLDDRIPSERSRVVIKNTDGIVVKTWTTTVPDVNMFMDRRAIVRRIIDANTMEVQFPGPTPGIIAEVPIDSINPGIRERRY